MLPAVQAARETARKSQCANNLKQWGLALQNYENINRTYPFGTIRGSSATVNSDGSGGPNGIYYRMTYVVSLWPQLELQTLYKQYNFNYSFYASINQPAVMVQSPVYFCPSDRFGMWQGDPYTRSRGNYVLSWGNGSYWQTESNYLPSPFGPNRTTIAAKIRDGLSNTMFMSELVQALNDTDFDFRGDFINDDLSCAEYMTINTPNSGIDSTVCVNPQLPGPCQFSATTYVSARSNHPGGVDVLIGDGSVRFISDSINLSAWQALGSMNGNELVSATAVGL